MVAITTLVVLSIQRGGATGHRSHPNYYSWAAVPSGLPKRLGIRHCVQFCETTRSTQRCRSPTPAFHVVYATAARYHYIPVFTYAVLEAINEGKKFGSAQRSGSDAAVLQGLPATHAALRYGHPRRVGASARTVIVHVEAEPLRYCSTGGEAAALSPARFGLPARAMIPAKAAVKARAILPTWLAFNNYWGFSWALAQPLRDRLRNGAPRVSPQPMGPSGPSPRAAAATFPSWGGGR